MKHIIIYYLFLLLASTKFYSQDSNVKANVDTDFFGNLYVNAELNNLNVNKDTIVIDDQILIHKDFAKLIRGVKLNNISLIEYKPLSNKIDYVINLPKGKNSSYLKSSDFFITTINYLPIIKRDFTKKKKFDLHFNFPEKFQVIYPDNNDLEETYTYPPPIIAGNFIKNTILDFNVFTLKKDSKKSQRINEIITEIDNVFSFFQKKYPHIIKKPKIIFLPIENPSAKTLENAIIFDSNILDDNVPLEKRLIAHEVSHLWWGVGGITFDNHILTEGIAEYLALKYMSYIGENKYVYNRNNAKLYHIEGDYELKKELESSKSKKDSYVYSYELAPLVLFDMENKGIKVFDKLIEFYNIHQNETTKIPYIELFKFLNSENGYDINFNFPDFYIVENDGKVQINCTSNMEKNVEVEFTDNLDKTYKETLNFINNHKQFEFNAKDFKKVVIDPDYKVLQTTRLNDVWNADNKSIFYKNNYYLKNEIKPEILEKSQKFIDYLFSNSPEKIEYFTCQSNFWLIKKINELKNEIDKDQNKVITGASTYFKIYKDLNKIEIKLTYLTNEKSKFIYFNLYFDKNYEYLQNFKLESELDEKNED
jgi:hypothetical protein